MQGHEARLAAFRQLNQWNYRARAIELVNDGVIDCRSALINCLNHMSQDDIKDMLTDNELIDD
jgi:hypothetical protein